MHSLSMQGPTHLINAHLDGPSEIDTEEETHPQVNKKESRKFFSELQRRKARSVPLVVRGFWELSPKITFPRFGK